MKYLAQCQAHSKFSVNIISSDYPHKHLTFNSEIFEL